MNPWDEPIQDEAGNEDDWFLVHHAGRDYRVPRYCPHRGGRLDHGEVDESNGRIICPLHYSAFRLSDGVQVAGPACSHLRVQPVE